MTRYAGPKLAAYAALSAAGLLAALVTARPELVALTAPFLLALAAGLALATPPALSVELGLADERVLEGDDVTATLTVASTTAVDQLDLYLRLPEDLEVSEGANPVALRLRAGERRELEVVLHAARWGAHPIGPLYVRARDPLGLLVWEAVSTSRRELRAYPREEYLRRVVRASNTTMLSGNDVSRLRGEGIEFADLRRFVVGDPVKRVNWRASARRGELWVNEAHPERNTDVILFVDSFAEARLEGTSTLDLAVRATTALAHAYVGRRDRVGLISFGGVLRWLVPSLGLTQLYKIVDALLDTEIVLSYYWRDLEVIPRRTLPPSSLVIALSPLLDARSVGALLELRSRGHDLSVIDVSPVPFASHAGHGLDGLAFDIWQLRRDALRHRLQQAGVAVSEWRHGSSLQLSLEEVQAFRRYARHAHV